MSYALRATLMYSLYDIQREESRSDAVLTAEHAERAEKRNLPYYSASSATSAV